MTNRLSVVGTGLIGGSIALAARTRQPQMTVTGYDADGDSVEAALERGAINRAAASLGDAVDGADLVVLALPVDQIPSACRNLAGDVPGSAVVTDVGSAKVTVVNEGEAAFGDRFVGGHPMAGSERHGIEAADRALFESAWWILTPTAATSSGAYSTVSRLVMQLGAIPVAVDPAVHDTLVARLSHLPQLTAAALVGVALESGDRDALLGLAGGGFRDVTRIAASDPDLWVAILRSNRRSVLEALEGFTGTLEHIARLISEDGWEELRTWLDRSRAARVALFAKPDYGGRPVALSMMVPDRPGVLAEVTKAAGELGANIEDLRITHSTEGGRGRLELVVAGSRASDLLARALGELGYRVERTEGPGGA